MLLHAMRWLSLLLPVTFLMGPAPGDIGAILIAVLFLLHSCIHRDWQWVRAPWLLALLAFWVWGMAISAFAQYPMEAFERAALWVRYPVFAAALAHAVWSDDRTQRRFLAVLLAVVLFLIGDMLWQYVNGTDLFGRARHEMASFVRLTGPFSSPRPGIVLVWIGFPALLFLWKLLEPRPALQRVALWSVAMLGFIAALYLSGERMAFLFCLLGFAVIVVLLPRGRIFALGGMAAVAVLVFGVLLSYPDLLNNQVTRTRSAIVAFWDTPYGQVTHSAIAVWEAHPISGVGFKHFRSACPEAAYGPVATVASRCGLPTHNPYLELLAETGLVGLMLFMASMVAILRLCWRARRMVRHDAVLLGLFATLIIRLWPIAAVTSQFVAWSAVPFWALTALLVARVINALKPAP